MTDINISAALVKELRETTGAGMMECKKALVESGGDMQLAIEALRISGAAKANKKSDRTAAEGKVDIASTLKSAVMVETNCETDFVGRDSNFVAFVKSVAQAALDHAVETVEDLSALTLPENITVEQARRELVAKLGENIQIRRMVKLTANKGTVGAYIHGNRIGVLVELDIENPDLGRDIAMHIAASKPLVVTPDQISAELIEKEKEIYTAQSAASGKPQDIIDKMVVGRMKKYLDEVSLVGQPFVKDPDVTVGQLLGKHRAKVLKFCRYEVGEGIEKVTEDFREAVMSQVQGN